jgi:hypothetical protein
MADPLSTATRATKRNLLVASVLAISANAFNVSVDKIPVGGLSITFDDRLFAFLLLVVLIYFLCTFILYYIIDIKNIEDTVHQTTVEAAFNRRIANFPSAYTERMQKDLQGLAPAYRIVLVSNFAHFLSIGNTAQTTYQMTTHAARGVAIVRDQEELLYKQLDERHRYWISQFPKARAADKRRAQLPLTAMRAMYFLRNYFFDGALPIALGLFALVAILGRLNLAWIQNYLPSFKALSPSH